MTESHEPQEMPVFSGEMEPQAMERPLSAMTAEMEAEAVDPFGAISEKKKFNAGSLVLVAVVVVACGGLWFMRSLSKAGAASVASSEMDASIEKFISGLGGPAAGKDGKPSNVLPTSDANVLAVLNGSYTERQVPLQAVQRNPFLFYDENAVQPTEATVAPVDTSAATMAKRQADRKSQFEKAAGKLELKSVLMGSNPLANISGRIVRRGEEIVGENVALRIEEITKDSATLIGEDASLNLSVSFTIMLKR